MQNISEEIATDNNFNIVDILLIDHAYLKECIEVLTDNQRNKQEKLFYSRTFLDTLKKHTNAEQRTVYESLAEMDEIRMNILEAIAGSSMTKFKYQTLIPRINKMKVLDDMAEAEMKSLAELVRHQITEEEHELFPKMRENLDAAILNEIGFQFLILRKFTPQDLKDFPEIQKQIYQANPTEQKSSRKNVYQWSSNFVRKVNQYIGSLVNQASATK